jgi:prepilin-type N-terminal cleavage/methylation domain-containing protein/prepilin-type processing-associated H-X9-DG protein
MKRQKAFTLIELLVVIAIIALLLAILIPSLNKARELANRIVCGSRIKSLLKGSITYASSQGGMYVPAGYSPYYDPTQPNGGDPPNQSCNWCLNAAYRKYIDIDSYRGDMVTLKAGQMAFPKAFMCPSDKISKDPLNISQYNVLTSFAYNITDWTDLYSWDPMWKGRTIGHRVDAMRKPAEKMHFIDGIDWWTNYAAADYTKGWDVLGQAKSDCYRNQPSGCNPAGTVYAPVFYRHNEGAVIGFYDGHTDYMKKEAIYDRKLRDTMWTNK